MRLIVQRAVMSVGAETPRFRGLFSGMIARLWPSGSTISMAGTEIATDY